MGTRGEVLIKYPRGYARLTNLPPLLHHSLSSLFLPFRRFVVFFFSYSYPAFSRLSQRKVLTGVLIDFTPRKSLEFSTARRKIVTTVSDNEDILVFITKM